MVWHFPGYPCLVALEGRESLRRWLGQKPGYELDGGGGQWRTARWPEPAVRARCLTALEEGREGTVTVGGTTGGRDLR